MRNADSTDIHYVTNFTNKKYCPQTYTLTYNSKIKDSGGTVLSFIPTFSIPDNT